MSKKLSKVEDSELIMEASLPNVAFGIVGSTESRIASVFKITFDVNGKAKAELFKECEDRHEAIEVFKIAVADAGILNPL